VRVLRKYLVLALRAFRSTHKCSNYCCELGHVLGSYLDHLLGTLNVFSGTDRLIQAKTTVVPEKQITVVSFKIPPMSPFTDHSTYAVVRTSLNKPHNTT
jgi:hypothetical protein